MGHSTGWLDRWMDWGSWEAAASTWVLNLRQKEREQRHLCFSWQLTEEEHLRGPFLLTTRIKDKGCECPLGPRKQLNWWWCEFQADFSVPQWNVSRILDAGGANKLMNATELNGRRRTSEGRKRIVVWWLPPLLCCWPKHNEAEIIGDRFIIRKIIQINARHLLPFLFLNGVLIKNKCDFPLLIVWWCFFFLAAGHLIKFHSNKQSDFPSISLARLLWW